MYDRQVALVSQDPVSASVYGIKACSALNRSRYYHVVDGLPSDVMHDVLEGVLPLQFKLMLRKFILEDKMFTLNELNKRVHIFAFGANDACSKPSLLKPLNGDNPIRQSGIKFIIISTSRQTLCYFVIVGHSILLLINVFQF